MAEGMLQINLVTPRGPIASRETDAVTAPGDLGEFEVLPGHVPFLTTLHPGVLVLGERDPEVFAVGRGYLRVDREGAIEILVESAMAAGKVDTEAAEASLRESLVELEKWKDKPHDGEWRTVKDLHDWAQAQLDARARA
ncbi:ATP synthase F1 subunit epsilon [Haliangium sp.]|uniref:ATP synthase F1 subunit epsilon n=1 Tax=Haliangium sp. TaxID=2663208 RepID=UPI003D10CD3F